MRPFTLANIIRHHCSLASFTVGLAALLLCSLSTTVIAQENQEPLTEITNSDPSAPWQVAASHTQYDNKKPRGNVQNAIDGVPTSRWSSGKKQTYGMWFELDLGSQQTVDRLVLRTSADPAPMPNKNDYVRSLDFPKSFMVVVSPTSLTEDEWQERFDGGASVATGESTMTSADVLAAVEDDREIDKNTIINFSEQQNVQYIRIYLTNKITDPNYWWSISDIQVFKQSTDISDNEDSNEASLVSIRSVPKLHVCAATATKMTPLQGKEDWSASTNIDFDQTAMSKFGMTTQAAWDVQPNKAIDTQDNAEKTRWSSYKA